MYAWLNQTGTPGITATVQWEAATGTDVGIGVKALIPYDTWNIIKNGSFDSQTGLVTYQSTSYRFRFETVSGEATMEPYG